jgi:hypothetical protein
MPNHSRVDDTSAMLSAVPLSDPESEISVEQQQKRPRTDDETEALIEHVVMEKFGGHDKCKLPANFTLFSSLEDTKEQLQRYALTNWFAIVETQHDIKNHRYVYSCAQGGTPSDSRNLTSNAVIKEIFEVPIIGVLGNINLQRRTTSVSSNLCVVTVSIHRIKD